MLYIVITFFFLITTIISQFNQDNINTFTNNGTNIIFNQSDTFSLNKTNLSQDTINTFTNNGTNIIFNQSDTFSLNKTNLSGKCIVLYMKLNCKNFDNLLNNGIEEVILIFSNNKGKKLLI